MDDDVRAALGITAVVVTMQELPLIPTFPPMAYRVARAGLAVGASVMINRRGPLQRLALTAVGVWGAAELLQLTYSTLFMGADNLLFRLNQLQRRR